MVDDSLHRKLRPLIGHQFDYLGEVWTLIEILADTDSVVLRRCDDCQSNAVQRNAFGMPTRRSPGTLTLPVSTADGDDYSQDILLLLEGKRR